MFELLPEGRLRLPSGAGFLRPGMDERAARWAVATVADVRGTWTCGAGWSFTARYGGLLLDVHGDTRDRYGRCRDAPGLASLALERDPYTLAGPSGCPVVLRDVDVFGHPAAEVLEALGLHGSRSPGAPPTWELHTAGTSTYLTSVSADVHVER